MTEGELKKRIHEVNAEYDYDETPSGEYERVPTSDYKFDDIIDEAKKEAPKLPKRANSADRIENSISWMEWYEKWFGSE